jgi:uncharacterized protein YjbJ (UPF0337 family)
MNKDQIKGAVKDAAGRMQEQAGKFVGSYDLQVKGIYRQVQGQTQKSFGDVREAVKDRVTR